MKKFFTLAFALVASVVAMAQDHLEIKDFSIMPGETKTVSMDLISAEADVYCAFQCDIVLPQGLGIVKTRRGYDVDFNKEADRTSTKYHSLSFADQADGSIRVLVYSTTNEKIYDKDGALIDIPVTVDATMAPGEYEIKIANTLIAKDGKPENGSKVDSYICKVTIGDPTGINEMNASDIKSVSYNVAGQRVNENAKGIVISNGKKIKK